VVTTGWLRVDSMRTAVAYFTNRGAKSYDAGNGGITRIVGCLAAWLPGCLCSLDKVNALSSLRTTKRDAACVDDLAVYIP
jgi:hypothetical protein